MSGTNPEMLDARQFAEYVHITPDTAAQWRYKGIGPKFVKIGPRRVLYRRTDVDSWLDAQTVQSTAEVSAA